MIMTHPLFTHDGYLKIVALGSYAHNQKLMQTVFLS